MHCKRQSAKHVLSPWPQSCLHAPGIICSLNVFSLFIHSFPPDKHCHTDEWELERANCICSVKGLHSLETQMSLTKNVITLSRHYHKSLKKLIWEIRCLLLDSCVRSQISYNIMFLIGLLAYWFALYTSVWQEHYSANLFPVALINNSISSSYRNEFS